MGVFSMMRLHSVVLILFVCGLLDVRGWSPYELNLMTHSGEWWNIYCCDWNGNAVETWCGSYCYNGRCYYRDCCDTCFWYGGSWTDCLNVLSGSTWNQRAKRNIIAEKLMIIHSIVIH